MFCREQQPAKTRWNTAFKNVITRHGWEHSFGAIMGYLVLLTLLSLLQFVDTTRSGKKPRYNRARRIKLSRTKSGNYSTRNCVPSPRSLAESFRRRLLGFINSLSIWATGPTLRSVRGTHATSLNLNATMTPEHLCQQVNWALCSCFTRLTMRAHPLWHGIPTARSTTRATLTIPFQVWCN